MTIYSTAIILMAFLITVAKEKKIELKKLNGTVQNDILKEYIARGTYINSPHNSMKLVTDDFEYCNENIPNWNTISISGYHIREAGSNEIQELAFTLANGLCYVDHALDSGLNVDEFVPLQTSSKSNSSDILMTQ